MKNFFLFLVYFLLAWPRLSQAESGIVIIINAQQPLDSISNEAISNYYFKKKKQWPSGTNVRFVDHGADSAVRKAFLSKVLKTAASEVDLFWIGQKLYTGDSAPLKVRSDAMVIQFVASFPGAIGYISPETDLKNTKVKSIKIMDSDKD